MKPPRIARLLLVAAPAVASVALAAWKPPGDEPTFARDIAPILYRNCAVCHRPEGPAPFDLLSYEDARARGPLIAALTQARVMPPWLPDRPRHAFANERRLTDEAIEAIRRWVEAGMPRGDPAEEPLPPEFPGGWQLGEPDLVVAMPEPYPVMGEHGEAGAHEEFRNFVIAVPIETDRWVEAVELRFDAPKLVHHATLMVDPSDSSRRRDSEDPGPGFDGMGPASEARQPTGFFLGWTPGKVPTRIPPDIAWRLERGSDLVLQLHLRPIERPAAVRGQVGLHFAERPPARTAVLLRLGSESLDIPPGARSYAVEDSLVLPVEVEVLGLYPHAHYLGEEMSVVAVLPDGGTRWLLHIPRWDFNWQDEYRYREPVRLPRGTVLTMRYTYDNSTANPRNPRRAPEHVRYGPHSTDEMADLMIQVVAVEPDESAELARVAWLKSLSIHRQGLEAAVRWRAEDERAHYELGMVLAALGRHEEAIARYREALRLAPRYARAHNNLGIALQTVGRLDEAVRHYRLALETDPGYARASHNLAIALEAKGEVDEAIRFYRLAIDADPKLAPAHVRLAEVLRARGKPAEAIEHYRRGLEIEPDDARARLGLGFALGSTGRFPEAIAELREAIRLDPRWPAPLIALAELLARHPDPAIRRPAEAVRLAERAAALTERPDPAILAVLAAAQASAGEFGHAAETAERALALASAVGARDLADRLRHSLERYRQRRPE
ncbi:MAG: tetratricopeptide repeat protein [Gemmatimonadota bacterium]